MKKTWLTVLRVVICMILMTAIYILQTSFGARLALFGGHLDLLPMVTAAAGFCMGSSAGLFCGLYAGILYDAGAGIEGIYPMYYMFWGILCGYLGTRIQRFRGLCTAGCALGMHAVLFALRYLFFFQFEGEIGLRTFAHHLILNAVLTLVFAPLVYRLISILCLKKKTRAREGGYDGAS